MLFRSLRYLITQSDVVPDELGYLGLVDDIYVIEQAYEMVGQRSSWGALIDRFVRKWPILEQVVFDENTGPVRLSVYLQVVSGLIFHNLSSDRKRINIIVKEVGIIPLLVSFLWVVNRMRENNEDRENNEEKLEDGSYVTLIGDRKSVV